MFFADDHRHIRVVAAGEKFLQRRPEGVHEGPLHTALDEEIVGLHAGLSRVEHLAEGDPPGCQRDGWPSHPRSPAFSAQLQRHGGQMPEAASMTTLPTATEPVKKM